MTNSVDTAIAFRTSVTSVHPVIIQGGMGVSVSGWQLARAVGCGFWHGIGCGAGAPLAGW
jgi:NAD(P)H-dependent flavin oxidoreductase YrpB (nitropropane dioxygenase family)